MTDWTKIEAVFLAAAEQPEAEREAFVTAATENQPELARVVQELLAADLDASGVLHGVVGGELAELARQPARSGLRLGAYRLGAVIGEGGMGIVYAASRDDAAYELDVAIKILKYGHGSREAITRLRAERQILANLEHPNIVRLLDGGGTEDGSPYLVMELVHGVPLTEYLRQHSLSVDARIRLFREVIEAVQFAHDAGVIHRDLKPTNILVDAAGATKLLDFGIAKLVEADREAQTRGTLLTPEYASPEQARGEAVSVASDVYSLGAVLYEVLTGRPPHTGDALTILARLATESPTPPSAHTRGISRDLDAIVLKALEKDVSRRYTSAEALGDDLSRYLARLPVRARRPTAAYRVAIFVQRHRRPLFVGLAALMITGGAIALAWPDGAGREWKPQLQLLPAHDEASDAPVISPDGTHIAYSSDRDQTGWFRIYIANLDGSAERVLTPPDVRAFRPSWSPDGREIWFIDFDREFSLCRLPVGGGPVERVEPMAFAVPCGDAMLVIQYQSPDCQACQRLTLRGPDAAEREVARFAPGTSIDAARCDAAGTRVAYTQSARAAGSSYAPGDLWLLDLASGARRALTNDHLRNSNPVFASDGRTIVFTSARGGRMNLWEISAGGGEPRQITAGEGNDLGADVSPDGRTLAYNVDISSTPLFARHNGAPARRIVSSRPILSRIVATPDGEEVIATDLAPLESEIVAIDVATGAIRTLANGTVAAPTPDGREIVISTGDDGRHIAAIPRTGGAARSVGDLDGPALALRVGSDGTIHAIVVRDGVFESWRLPLAGGAAQRDAPPPWCFILPAPAGGASVWVRCDAGRHWSAVVVRAGETPDPAAPGLPLTVGDTGAFDSAGKFYFQSDGRGVYRTDVATGATTEVFAALLAENVAVSPDGQTIYTAESIGRVQRTLITNFADRPRP